MNVSNLRQNNVNNITLENYVVKPFSRDQRISITLGSCFRFTSGNYGLKPYKWNKENVIITFGNYVRIMLGSCVRLTLGRYVIKQCKWGQKIRCNYVWKLRQDYVTKKVTLELSQKVALVT